MFAPGDLVLYIRPHPDDEGLVHRVAKVREDSDGIWVLLEEEPEDSVGSPVEISPGVFGGFGCWEQACEFRFADKPCASKYFNGDNV